MVVLTSSESTAVPLSFSVSSSVKFCLEGYILERTQSLSSFIRLYHGNKKTTLDPRTFSYLKFTAFLRHSKNNGQTFTPISTESFHVCHKAKQGNVIFFAGNAGKLGKFVK